MRIIQLLPTLSFGDAVGNDTLALQQAIKNMGFETAIYAENIDRRLPANTAIPFDRFPILSDDDVILYHASTGTELNYRFADLDGRKVMRYHNITPPEFFQPYSLKAAELCRSGYKGIRFLADRINYAIADSEYNRQDLIRMGFHCPIDVCPILIPFDDYQKVPNQKLVKKYTADGFTNILFVGRIAPNKKQEDIILTYAYYKKNINPRSRLFLVGSWTGTETYYTRLQDYVKLLNLEDVIFTGSVPFTDILAYYRIADCFLCLSEHEGFCVPLVEAMFFDTPIIAYDCCAISETLGGGGFLMSDKDPKRLALFIQHLLSDSSLKESILEKQRNRLSELQYEVVSEQFKTLMNAYIHSSCS